jgi:hypothetical protein
VSYSKYIAWKRLTNGGRLNEMSPEQQREFDALGITEMPELTPAEQAEAKRRYLEVSSRASLDSHNRR